MPTAFHLNLDDAWDASALNLPTLDAREWGPQLRFSAPSRLVEAFFRERNGQLGDFVVYGSGDFHHLSALWIRRTNEPLVVVSFDNHPDWDIRPPKWCCGSWVNRALELPNVQKVSVWGCGNFECWWPGQAFGNRRAERAGKLDVHPWADDRPAKEQRRRGAIFRGSWRDQFDGFVRELGGGNVYVTVDLDCLRAGDAATNWESGKFSTEDVAWALGRLRSDTRVVAGDICGAFSPPRYARVKQRFVSTIDHPKLPPPDAEQARGVNQAAFAKLWPILSGTSG
ncbi:MAG: hypothetical protein H0W20_15535 [Chthoniobacterales bacterium]|nr:hypothetical protein [Chthoniobacterales bacterium]